MPILLIALLGLIALAPLALASPPDPSWIRGIYDGGDYDDVVVAVTAAHGTFESSPLTGQITFLTLLGSVPLEDAADGIAAAPSAARPRAPPLA